MKWNIRKVWGTRAIWKWVGGTIGALSVGAVLVISATMMGHTAISQLVGLAVAQTSTLWNNIKDAAAGDGLSNGILAQSLYLYNGATFDRVRGTNGSMNVAVVGTVTPADAFVNPTNATSIWGLNAVFNGTTWDRRRSATADTMVTTGMAAVGNMVWNNSSYDRMRSVTGDAQAVTGLSAAGNMLFNGGTTYDRWRSVSATNNVAVTSLGVAYTVPLSTWQINVVGGTAAQATVSKASGGGTVRHVATTVTVCVSANGTAQPPLVFNLRDGATGVGTIIWTVVLSAPITGTVCVPQSGLNISGTAATAMTIESAAATAVASQASVSLTGYSTP